MAEHASTNPYSAGRRAASVALGVWAAVVLVAGSSLMAAHVIALPRPTDAAGTPPVVRALMRGRAPGEAGRWLVAHILLQSCPCSQRVRTHLVERGARADVVEKVLFIGDDGAEAAALRGEGFAVETLTREALEARYGLESSTLMVVVAPDGRLAYAGGYTFRKQGPDFQDGLIITAALSGGHPAALPVFGCAVSRRLETALDPFGLRR